MRTGKPNKNGMHFRSSDDEEIAKKIHHWGTLA